MKSDLAAFLRPHTPLAAELAVWHNGLIRLHIAGYISDQRPPLEYVTSVRGLIFRDDTILVLRNLDSTHIVPGGRREAGETLEETLRREVLEESGWTIRDLSMLGFMHFHHRSPKPPDYPFPYPDFLQIVYVAEAAVFVPQSKVAGDYEQESIFRPIAEAQGLDLGPCERLYLETAVRLRAASRPLPDR